MTDAPASESILRVGVPTAPAPTYPVRLERGAFRRLGELVAELGTWSRAVVVADSNVAGLYGEDAVRSLEAAGTAAGLETFPAGEAAKSRSTWSELTDRLLAAGIGRDGLVVALGGGVTGDLAGFVAATCMRGLPWVVVPTSLLAMLDSAVGGKTAVDTPAGKNLVGAFHHPRLVVADPDLLATLPPAHVRAGLAEGVKTAAIRDVALFAWMEEHAAELRGGDTEALGRLVRECVRHKAEIVAADPEEAGLRQILNFGHTAGHALELLSGYSMLHGEAVAAGMRVESRLGEVLGVTETGSAERLARLLDACGLPDSLAAPAEERPFEGEMTPTALLAAARGDKKARSGQVRWVLLERIGAVAPDGDGTWSHAPEARQLAGGLAAAFPAAADVRDSAS